MQQKSIGHWCILRPRKEYADYPLVYLSLPGNRKPGSWSALSGAHCPVGRFPDRRAPAAGTTQRLSPISGRHDRPWHNAAILPAILTLLRSPTRFARCLSEQLSSNPSRSDRPFPEAGDCLSWIRAGILSAGDRGRAGAYRTESN